MPQDHTFRGVPMALQHDAWWLLDPGPPPRLAAKTGKTPVLPLLALLLVADLLFWHQTPGLSLAVFAVAVFAAALNRRPGAVATVVLGLAVLPVIDYVQPLSVAILVLGLPASIAMNRGGAPLSLLRHLPSRGIRDLWMARHLVPIRPARSLMRNWAFPFGGTLVLLSLLSQANPVLADWIAAVTRLPLDPVDLILRALFWGGLALILWPLLTVAPDHAANLPAIPLPRLGLNATSITNALILFNAALALQTALDARYLWTGTAPLGMTLANYAHRGAYPLLATALLAGAFALAARPWLAERRMLKPLMVLWLAQNVALTLSALLRLDLYVTAFGLTYLRAHAAIWMLLVAAGLALTLAQIALHKPNRWLLLRCVVLGAATLYLCAFVNFAAVIARVNIAGHQIDPAYLCSLPAPAAAELYHGAPRLAAECLFDPPRIAGWRDWGFRNWRVLHTLRATEAAHENPRRR